MFRIVRFYADPNRPYLLVKKVETEKEAQEHCNDVEASSRTCTMQENIDHTSLYGDWFDGYRDYEAI